MVFLFVTVTWSGCQTSWERIRENDERANGSLDTKIDLIRTQ